MAEFWKSTPSYWCKFCSTYVKDTSIERKNHEASFKHQNNIQRSLRDLHKNKEREVRDQQRAKDEVARLNGLVEGKPMGQAKSGAILGLKDKGKASQSTGPKLGTAAQRKLQAEQLLALGVQLPEELKREVQGISSWEVVAERVIELEQDQERSLADIIKEEHDVKLDKSLFTSKGVHKRKATAVDDEADAEHGGQSTAWGSKFKHYPGQNSAEGEEQDLDALLNAVSKRKTERETREEMVEGEKGVKREADDPGTAPSLNAVPDVNDAGKTIKQEERENEVPAVIFKKRKVKK